MQDNSTIIRHFIEETINQGQIDSAVRFVWEDVVEQVPFPGQGPGLEGLKDILDILTGMDEKPVMQSELLRLIQTAKVQAQLWANPASKNAPMRAHDVGVSDYDKDASGEKKMADLKKRAARIVERAQYHVAKHKTAEPQGGGLGVYETGTKRYPEFKPLVDKIVRQVAIAINSEANKIKSDMPYKAQFTLEEVIRELQERV